MTESEIDLTKTYDAVVVGSGAAGGMAAHVLTSHGLKVLLLEAGPDYPPDLVLPSDLADGFVKLLEWPALLRADAQKRPRGLLESDEETGCVGLDQAIHLLCLGVEPAYLLLGAADGVGEQHPARL